MEASSGKYLSFSSAFTFCLPGFKKTATILNDLFHDYKQCSLPIQISMPLQHFVLSFLQEYYFKLTYNFEAT